MGETVNDETPSNPFEGHRKGHKEFHVDQEKSKKLEKEEEILKPISSAKRSKITFKT